MEFNDTENEKIKAHNAQVMRDEALNEIELILDKYKNYIDCNLFVEAIRAERRKG